MKKTIYLDAGFNPSQKKKNQNGIISPNRGENKNIFENST